MTPTTHDQVQSPAEGQGLGQAARDEAGHLKDTTREASRDVAGTAREQAADVAQDVRQQTRRLAGETRDQLTDQAMQRKDAAVEGLRSIGDELRTMARHEGQSGWATQLVRQGADYTDQAANYLQNRRPGELLDEVRGLARRRPGTFLLGAAVAGAVAGRLVRALAAERSGSESGTPPGRGGGPSYPTGGTYTTGPVTGHAGGGLPPYDVPAEDIASAGRSTNGPVGPGPIPAMPPQPSPAAPDPDPGFDPSPRFGPGQRGTDQP
jgi:hypothetical protein